MMKNNAQSERYAGVASPWLFPGESDGHKTETTLSGQIIDRITKEIGIRVTPASVSPLGRGVHPGDPANYEFVRRVLGHENLQTTINFYERRARDR